MYRYMDSHPHQGSQMPFTQNLCPTCSAAPPQMGYEWRPYYHSCCNHSCFPGNYPFQPYYQMAPPTPFHWHGCRPMYPEPYPTHYAPPPYYNPMEQPRPEHEKNDTDCGFPYHGFSNKGGNNVKIVKHEADDWKKEKESVVPAGLKDCPYPIVWIPPGYVKNGEKAAPLEQDKKGQSEEDQHQSSAMEPGVSNVWFPPDSNGIIRSAMEGGEGRKGQKKKADKNGRLPFPIIWMPPFEKTEETEEKEQKQRTSGEEPKLNFKIIPVMPLEGDEGGNKSRAAQENSEGKGVLNNVEEAADQGYIPAKEREETTEGKRVGSVSMHGENGGKKKPTDSAKGQSSKLPPVCLRVDPLPRKKNGSGNGSSRSPSPPGQRGKLQKTSNDGTSGSLPSEALKAQETTTGKSHGPEQKKKEIQVVEQKVGGNGSDEDPPSGSHNPAMSQPPVKSTSDSCIKVSDDQGVEKPSGEHQAKTSAKKDAEGKVHEGGIKDQRGRINKSQPDNCGEDKAMNEQEPDKAPKAEKSNLSDSEAAVIIQSAYRGFEVRKWEPLKKLKQLAKVREEVDEIRNRIQALESLSDIQIDGRERVIIGETIMRLLLKLDTIQGLHPDFRNVRKLLATELVSLQEKLDSIMNQKPVFVEPVEKNSTNIEQIFEEKDMGAAVEEESTEGLQDSSSAGNYLDETCDLLGHSQSPGKEAASVKSEGENIPDSEPKSVEEQVQVKSENDIMGAEVDNNLEQHAADMGSVLEPKDKQDNGNLDSDQVVLSEPNSDSGLAPVGEKCNSEVGSAEYPSRDTIHYSNAADKIEEVVHTAPPISGEGHLEMNGLPQGTIEENTAMTSDPELKKDDKIEAGGEWWNDGKIEAEENAAQEEEEANMPAIAESIEAGEAKASEGYQADSDKATVYVTQLQEHSVEGVTEDSEEPQPVVSFVAEEASEGYQADSDKATVYVTQLQGDSVEAVTEDSEEPQPVVSFVAEEASDMNQQDVQEEHSVEEEKQAAKEEAVAQEVQFSEFGKDERNSSPPGITESAAEGRRSNQEEIENEKLLEENRKLREMMEQLINAGKEQLTVISNLTGRVKDLERKLTSRKKKLKTRRHRAPTPTPKPAPPSLKPCMSNVN